MADGTGKILIVDDEQEMRALLKDVLEGRGHQVAAAANGREALKCLAEEEYAVVLSDIRMKELPGIELLAEVKRTYPDTNVILMTAFGSMESAIEAMKTGGLRLSYEAGQDRRADPGHGKGPARGVAAARSQQPPARGAQGVQLSPDSGQEQADARGL